MQPTRKKITPSRDYLNAPLQAAFLPRSELPVDEWVEKHIVLPVVTCPEPGPMRLSRTPYIRGILRAFGSIHIEHIVLVCGRQMGKSSALHAALAYAIAEDPGPALFVISTRELARYSSVNRLQLLLLHCEAVQRKLTGDRDDFTNLEIRFTDSVLSLVGGGSSSQMTSRPVRYLLRDEVDDITGDSSSPTDLLRSARETTSAFANRKIIDSSTPTTDTGNIWQLLASCQYVFEFWVPCTECGGYQIMLWDRIKFDSRDRAAVASNTWYECKYCHTHIRENKKSTMVIAGQWRARLTDNPAGEILEYRDADINTTAGLDEILSDAQAKKIGFHLPKWCALFHNTTWGEAAREFLEAVDAEKKYGDYRALRDWSQIWAARPWVKKAEPKAITDILRNRIAVPSLVVPHDFIVLTCGVDMALDGFWFVVIAWKRDMSGHLVQYGFLAGWDNLTALLWETAYEVEGEGTRMGISRLGIDTGGTKYHGDTPGTMTEACYEWLRNHGRGRAFGIKGASHAIRGGRKMQKSVIDKTPSNRPIPGGLINWLIDTSAFKDLLHYRLELPEGHAGRFTLPVDVGTDVIAHIVSEEKRLNERTKKFEWVKLSQSNHWLDATCYAFAVADVECLGGIRIIRPTAKLTEKSTENQAIPPTGYKLRRQSKWVSGWKY